MIRTFGNALTADLFNGERTPSVDPKVIARARVKLDAINAAAELSDLLVPPGNQLKALKGDLAGFHGIRVNKQWRIIFKWVDGGADEVTFIDYH